MKNLLKSIFFASLIANLSCSKINTNENLSIKPDVSKKHYYNFESENFVNRDSISIEYLSQLNNYSFSKCDDLEYSCINLDASACFSRKYSLNKFKILMDDINATSFSKKDKLLLFNYYVSTATFDFDKSHLLFRKLKDKIAANRYRYDFYLPAITLTLEECIRKKDFTHEMDYFKNYCKQLRHKSNSKTLFGTVIVIDVGEKTSRIDKIRDFLINVKTNNIPVILLEYNIISYDSLPNLTSTRLDGLYNYKIEKKYMSGFSKTNLSSILKTLDIKNILFCGSLASGCVYHTALDAKKEGFGVSVSTDLIDGFNSSSLNLYNNDNFRIFTDYKKLLPKK